MSLSDYQDCQITLITKHAKSIAIAPPFLEILGANIVEYNIDTDTLGTFSGEIERKGNALECARKKCEWPINISENQVLYTIASEGSFGPHPLSNLIPWNQEILYFIDRKRNFHLSVSHASENTNYRTKIVKSIEELHQFAQKIGFPSHAIILRPNMSGIQSPIFKGINTWENLEASFKECMKGSYDGTIGVETDMRAQFNPTRMHVIGELAKKLSYRLKTYCPTCLTPGWGLVSHMKGLACRCCGLATQMIKSEIFACVKCLYEENRERSDGKYEADPQYCPNCNP